MGVPSAPASPAHAVTSEFSNEICRFVLTCNCGSTFDTNLIDEALEWHELHMQLAPLNDELDALPITG
jgi:hypothetical protein